MKSRPGSLPQALHFSVVAHSLGAFGAFGARQSGDDMMLALRTPVFVACVAMTLGACAHRTLSAPSERAEGADRAIVRSAPGVQRVADRASVPVLEPGAIAPSPRGARLAAAGSAVSTPRADAGGARGGEPVVTVRVYPVHASEGEDGSGNTVSARSPVAIDLVREPGWQAGALTTTLWVGDRHFHNMGYPDTSTMRFIVADVSQLPLRAEVALQYGSHPTMRRVIAQALQVTP